MSSLIVAQRAIGAVVGGLVSDAAGQSNNNFFTTKRSSIGSWCSPQGVCTPPMGNPRSVTELLPIEIHAEFRSWSSLVANLGGGRTWRTAAPIWNQTSLFSCDFESLHFHTHPWILDLPLLPVHAILEVSPLKPPVIFRITQKQRH